MKLKIPEMKELRVTSLTEGSVVADYDVILKSDVAGGNVEAVSGGIIVVSEPRQRSRHLHDICSYLGTGSAALCRVLPALSLHNGIVVIVVILARQTQWCPNFCSATIFVDGIR